MKQEKLNNIDNETLGWFISDLHIHSVNDNGSSQRFQKSRPKEKFSEENYISQFKKISEKFKYLRLVAISDHNLISYNITQRLNDEINNINFLNAVELKVELDNNEKIEIILIFKTRDKEILEEINKKIKTKINNNNSLKIDIFLNIVQNLKEDKIDFFGTVHTFKSKNTNIDLPKHKDKTRDYYVFECYESNPWKTKEKVKLFINDCTKEGFNSRRIIYATDTHDIYNYGMNVDGQETSSKPNAGKDKIMTWIYSIPTYDGFLLRHTSQVNKKDKPITWIPDDKDYKIAKLPNNLYADANLNVLIGSRGTGKSYYLDLIKSEVEKKGLPNSFISQDKIRDYYQVFNENQQMDELNKIIFDDDNAKKTVHNTDDVKNLHEKFAIHFNVFQSEKINFSKIPEKYGKIKNIINLQATENDIINKFINISSKAQQSNLTIKQKVQKLEGYNIIIEKFINLLEKKDRDLEKHLNNIKDGNSIIKNVKSLFESINIDIKNNKIIEAFNLIIINSVKKIKNKNKQQKAKISFEKIKLEFQNLFKKADDLKKLYNNLSNLKEADYILKKESLVIDNSTIESITKICVNLNKVFKKSFLNKALGDISDEHNFLNKEETIKFLNYIVKNSIEIKVEIKKNQKFDLPINETTHIQLKDNSTNHITNWEDLSQGQKASIIISKMLNKKDKSILFIDQPEDDLDNFFVKEKLVNSIIYTLENRQIFMVSHSANATFLSDANNIIYNYKEGDKFEKVQKWLETMSKVNVKLNNENFEDTIKNIAIKILEGGKDAFGARYNIYKIESIDEEIANENQSKGR